MMRHLPGQSHQLPVNRSLLAGYKGRHFDYQVTDQTASITLNRAERKNSLTFDSYNELRNLFRAMSEASDIQAIILAGAGGNFCSGGDVHEIIGPLTKLDMPGLLAFTRLTGDLVKAIRSCPQPVIAAIDGICVGAGAILAMASDLRLATPSASTAFLFTRVGLAGCDMGACAMLPRLIGQGRASALLLTGRAMSAAAGERWGFYNRLVGAGQLLDEAAALAERLAAGPGFAHMMTKTMLNQEWSMSLETAIES